jgi:cell division septation protein DedD
MRRSLTLIITAVVLAQVLIADPLGAFSYGGATTGTFAEDGAAQVVAPDITVSGMDDFFPSASTGTVAILQGFAAGDVLSYTPPNCISQSAFNAGTGVLVMTGSSGCESPSYISWQQSFRAVRFSTTADTPNSTRVIRFTTNNQINGSHSVTVTVQAGSPNQPLAPTVEAGNASVTITVQPAESGLSARSHVVTATPSGRTCTVSNPTGSCIIDGLTNGTAYTFSSVAHRLTASSVASPSSVSVTPSAPNQPSPVQSIPVQSAPVASPTTGATPSVATPSSPKLSIGKKRSAASLAKLASLNVTSRSRVKLTVATSSRRQCRVSGATVQGVRGGICRVRVAVTTSGKTRTRTVNLQIGK